MDTDTVFYDEKPDNETSASYTSHYLTNSQSLSSLTQKQIISTKKSRAKSHSVTSRKKNARALVRDHPSNLCNNQGVDAVKSHIENLNHVLYDVSASLTDDDGKITIGSRESRHITCNYVEDELEEVTSPMVCLPYIKPR